MPGAADVLAGDAVTLGLLVVQGGGEMPDLRLFLGDHLHVHLRHPEVVLLDIALHQDYPIVYVSELQGFRIRTVGRMQGVDEFVMPNLLSFAAHHHEDLARRESLHHRQKKMATNKSGSPSQQNTWT